MTFEGRRLRAVYRALEPIRFPPGKAGNTLRGAFGLLAGPELFAPRAAAGPSGLADPPRPFVFRAQPLDGTAIPAGAPFSFDIHLFYPSEQMLAAFDGALRTLDVLGTPRARVALERTELSPALLFPLEAGPAAPSRIAVRFATPTELKSGGDVVERPEFAILFARIRDRLSTLRSFYGPGPLPVDFRALAAQAGRVQLTHCDLRHHGVQRRSSRTGQTHPVGGSTGLAVYEGDLAPFLPWLRAAEFTGVGRQTVWGKGAIEVRELPAT